jgi:carboxypeptidase family protein
MKTLLFSSLLVLGLTAAIAQQPPASPPGAPQQQNQGRGGRGQGGARDRAQVQPQGTATIAGRVLTADTGRPVKRASVMVSGGGRQGRSMSTDDQGRYQIDQLPAGTYTVTASKGGFVDAAYGQRRPMQPGVPLQVADGQQTTGIDLRMIRGGVITGRVLDEDGEPLARALVTVQRYQYVRGDRQLIVAGGDQSDDRGSYRIFGLPPGDYYVSANANSVLQVLGRGFPAIAAALGVGGGGAGGGRGGPGRGGFFGGPPEDSDPVGYAPTYYPGVVAAADAMKVTIAAGQEVGGIDFQIQLVTTATIRGIVVGGDGAVSGVGVALVPTDAGGGLFRAQVLRTGTQADGSFTISNVPPGHYLAVARTGGRDDDQRVAIQTLMVTGENLSNVSLMLQAGVRVAGNITVESAGTPAPTDYSSFRIDVPDVEPLPIGAGGGRGGGPNGTGARADKNGTFGVDNLLPGKHYIRVSGQGVWSLKSVSVAGRDVTDQPVDLKSGQDVDNVTIVVSDRSTDLSGAVRNGTGDPVAALTVIAFSADPQYWRSQSRQIQGVRTDQNGMYHIRGLPPGDYLIIAVDDAETGEWFDPSYLEQIRPGAQTFSLEEGAKKTINLKAPAAPPSVPGAS